MQKVWNSPEIELLLTIKFGWFYNGFVANWNRNVNDGFIIIFNLKLTKIKTMCDIQNIAK